MPSNFVKCQGPMGLLRRLAAETRLLGRGHRGRDHQRRLRQFRRLGAARVSRTDGERSMGLPAAASDDAGRLRALGLARHPLLSECARQRHFAGDRRARTPWSAGPCEAPVAAACLRKNPADGARSFRWGLDRARRADGPGRRLDHARGRPLGRHGAGARPDPSRLRRRHRGRLQHAACRHCLRHAPTDLR